MITELQLPDFNSQWYDSNSSLRVFTVSNFNYDFSYPGGTLVVSEANTTRTFRVDGQKDSNERIAYMDGSFKMAAPASDGLNFSVEIQEPFLNLQTPSQIRYETGVLKISNEYASFLVEADNGRSDTVSITTEFNGESPSTIDVPWSTWLDALSYTPPNSSAYLASLPDNARSDIIRSDNYTDILADVFSVVSGDRIVPDILKLPGYPLPGFPLMLVPSTEDGLGSPITQSCDNGGSVELRPYKFGARQITSGWNMVFDECKQSGANFVGTFFTRDFGNFTYGSENGLTVSNPPNRTQHVRGLLDYKHGPNRDGGPTVWLGFSGTYSDSNMIASTEEGYDHFDVSEASFFTAAIGDIYTLISGQFVLSSQSTGYDELSVLFANPFGQDYDSANFERSDNYYHWGTLVVSALNGNRMIVTVDNGDKETFDISIEYPDSDPYKAKEQWSDWHSKLAFKTDLHLR